jgi:CheY-like chemotaxis protein
MRASVSKNASVQTELTSSVPLIAADATQVRQVVMNMITNASDALEGNEGTIVVRTGVRELTAQQLDKDCTKQPPRPGRYVHVEVTDTGRGMDPDTVERMFDPFFSTKIAGRGLGLAAVLGIVRSHRGAIFVCSTVGKGTTCSVHFPVATDATVLEPVAQAARRVLVIDDEPIVVVAVKEILELEGYAVTTAHSGHDGIEMYRREPDAFIGVLLDMTMPRLSGIEVMRELRMIRSEARVILMSGYERSRAAQLGDPPSSFLQKPFRSEDLLAAVAKLAKDA